MNLERFLQQRKPNWQALETLLQRASRNLGELSAGELDELGRLYRMVTSDLALAQRDFPTQQVTHYLNQLAGRAHSVIYGGGPISRRALATFYTAGFPQLYRAILPYTTVAFVLFLLTALIAFVLVWRDPHAIYVIQGAAVEPLVRQVEAGNLWTDIPPAVRSAASATILTNNIQVTFITFAGGISAGIFTAWILALNGLHIGSIFGLLQFHGLALGLAEFVAAHGPVELSIIFAAGGCGLYVGDGLLRPGLQSRRAALVRRARQSVQLILGCAPLLVFSGIIEGFISPSGAPWLLKVAIGLLTGGALHFYWLRAGRRPTKTPADQTLPDNHAPNAHVQP
ncbi:MAG: stage II sporulation protein M [Litorilinea sp.]